MARGVTTISGATQQAAKLRSKGYIAFEVDGVLARVSKSKKPRSADVTRKLTKASRIGAIYAAHVKKRAMKGDYATKPLPYSTAGDDSKKGGRPSYVVSQAYSERTDAGKENHGRSSADWHKKAGSIPGNTTGLMWLGLQARNFGKFGVRIDFGGSSIGTSSISRVKTSKKGKKAKLGRKVRNQWKASAVFRNLKVNVLQPKVEEVQAMADSFATGILSEAVDVLEIVKAKTVGTTGDARLYAGMVKGRRNA